MFLMVSFLSYIKIFSTCNVFRLQININVESKFYVGRDVLDGHFVLINKSAFLFEFYLN